MLKLRAKIRMSEDEAWAFIEQARDVHVATIGQTGVPHLTTMWFAVINRQIVFNSYMSSQKMVNLSRDPRLTVLFAEGVQYRELKGVSITGVAHFVTDREENLRMLEEISKRNEPYTDKTVYGDVKPADYVEKRTSVIIEAHKMISWDHGKMP